MEVHVTELESYRTCGLYWWFSYREQLRPKQEEPGTPLWFGTGTHYALAEFYRRGVHPREALLGWGEYQGCSVPLLEEVLDHYDEVYRSDLDRWEPLSIETPVRVRVPKTRVYLVGTFDLVVRDRGRGGVWVVDHKTRTYFDSPEDLELNEQVTGYLWLAEKIGLSPRGVIWNEIKKASPRSSPRVQEFFRRTELLRSKTELDQFEDDLRETVREMSSKSLKVYANPGYQCSRWACPYRILCRARRQGSSIEDLRRSLFTSPLIEGSGGD